MTAKFNIRDNVEYVLRDKDGNIKPLFVYNSLGKFLSHNGVISPFNRSFLFGNFKESMVISNLVTTVGKALVAGRLNGSGSPAAATYIAVGTGAVAAAVGDTTLGTELATSGLTRAAATVSLVTTDTTNDTAQLVVTFTVSGSAAITESGVFNAASVGTLLARQVFSAVNVINGDSLQVTWKFDID